MSAELDHELAQFHGFIAQMLGNSTARVSPEEALDLWRAEHPTAEELADSVAAVKEALDDCEPFDDGDAGDVGTPLDEFDRDFRQRHGLPAKP